MFLCTSKKCGYWNILNHTLFSIRHHWSSGFPLLFGLDTDLSLRPSRSPVTCQLLLRLSEGPSPLRQHVSGMWPCCSPSTPLLFLDAGLSLPCPCLSRSLLRSWFAESSHPSQSSLEDISLPRAISCPTLISSEDFISIEITLLISLCNVLFSLSYWLQLKSLETRDPLLPYCPL